MPALTDVKIRNTKPSEKAQKLHDGGNLYIEIKPNGKRYWRYRYRIDGKENIFAIGTYPDLGLAAARTARDEARKLVKQGIHPSHQRKMMVAQQIADNADTFQSISTEWFLRESERKKWSSNYRLQIEKTLKFDFYPVVGSLPIRSITPAHILGVLKKMEKRGAETLAIMARQWCSSVFRYAVAHLKVDGDPTISLKDAIKRPTVKNNPPIPEDDIPRFLKALEGYSGYRSTTIAIKILMLTFVRTAELRGAVWDEFNFEAKLWQIPAERMKKRVAHAVPLSDQVLKLLNELRGITGHQKWLFPNTRQPSVCMSATTINRALEYMGFKDVFSAHGFRTTASTILNELGYRPDVIEKQLSHQDSNRVRSIYNKAEYLPERRELMQNWADYLDGLRS